MPSNVEMIDISSIDYDKKYYPRVNGQADWFTILRYTESLQANPRLQFPPIVVTRATGREKPFMLIDGLHRSRSYLKSGRKQIPAVVERIPQTKWMQRSVELNVTHGRPLDTGDKAWIATCLKHDGWQMPAVAELLKMKVESLEKIVSSRCVKISDETAKLLPEGRSNRQVNGNHVGFLKAPLIEANGTASAEDALQSQHAITSHDVTAILDSMLSILRAKVVDMAKEDIAARIKVIKRLLREL